MDAIGHRLKLLRLEQAQVLPGCVTVCYDLFRGITRHVLFYPNAAEPELPRAQATLKKLPTGALLVGDRLYASIQYFHHLARLKLYGVFRRNGRLTLKRLKVFAHKQGHGRCLEDGLVEVGCGVGQPTLILRLIRPAAKVADWTC